jgi:hypothetical protein
MQVSKGKKKQHKMVMLYGVPGVGKSTLASFMPNPIFVDLEHGTSELEVARIDNTSDMFAIYKWFSEQNDFETIVIDSWTKLEQKILTTLLTQFKKDSLASFPFGQGYELLKTEVDKHIKAWEYLTRKCGKNVMLIAHSRIKTFNEPLLEPYDRYEPDIINKCLTQLTSAFDEVFFYKFNAFISKEKAVSSGDRELYTKEQPAFIAKSRMNLPGVMTNPTEQQIKEFFNVL